MKSLIKIISVLAAFGISYLVGTASLSAREAPQLASQVKAGTLPPLNERLPEIPLMLPVEDEIGQYGGTLRRAFLGSGPIDRSGPLTGPPPSILILTTYIRTLR